MSIKSTKDIVSQAMVDISEYETELSDGRFLGVSADLTGRLVGLVADGAGLAVCHGSGSLLAKHGMDIGREEHAAIARDHLESIFRAFAAEIDVAEHSPVVIGYDRIESMDLDGFNKNTSFTPNSDHTEGREFLSTKCVHFDSATPFIGNVYGPYTNLVGGLPIVCNTREFARDNGIEPADLIELMPHSYNVAVKEAYSEQIIADYSVAVDVDLHGDMIMVVLYNEVAGGLAHAGTMPAAADPAQPAKRPLRHMEFQFADVAELGSWYSHYRLTVPDVKIGVPDAETPDHNRYHRGVDSAMAAQRPSAGA